MFSCVEATDDLLYSIVKYMRSSNQIFFYMDVYIFQNWQIKYIMQHYINLT